MNNFEYKYRIAPRKWVFFKFYANEKIYIDIHLLGQDIFFDAVQQKIAGQRRRPDKMCKSPRYLFCSEFVLDYLLKNDEKNYECYKNAINELISITE